MGKEERKAATKRLHEIVECQKRHLEELRKLAYLFKADIKALDPYDLAAFRDSMKDTPAWKALGCGDLPAEDYSQQIDAWLSLATNYKYLELKNDDTKLGIVLLLPDERQWTSEFVSFAKGDRSKAEATLMQKATERLELYFKASIRAEGWIDRESYTITEIQNIDGTSMGSIEGPEHIRIGVEYKANEESYMSNRKKLKCLLKNKLTDWYEKRLQYTNTYNTYG